VKYFCIFEEEIGDELPGIFTRMLKTTVSLLRTGFQ